MVLFPSCGVILAVGSFFMGGHEALPGLDTLLAEASRGMQGLAILAAWREKNIPREKTPTRREEEIETQYGIHERNQE